MLTEFWGRPERDPPGSVRIKPSRVLSVAIVRKADRVLRLRHESVLLLFLIRPLLSVRFKFVNIPFSLPPQFPIIVFVNIRFELWRHFFIDLVPTRLSDTSVVEQFMHKVGLRRLSSFKIDIELSEHRRPKQSCKGWFVTSTDNSTNLTTCIKNGSSAHAMIESSIGFNRRKLNVAASEVLFVNG